MSNNKKIDCTGLDFFVAGFGCALIAGVVVAAVATSFDFVTEDGFEEKVNNKLELIRYLEEEKSIDIRKLENRVKELENGKK
jgi:hypothetical protein